MPCKNSPAYFIVPMLLLCFWACQSNSIQENTKQIRDESSSETEDTIHSYAFIVLKNDVRISFNVNGDDIWGEVKESSSHVNVNQFRASKVSETLFVGEEINGNKEKIARIVVELIQGEFYIRYLGIKRNLSFYEKVSTASKIH